MQKMLVILFTVVLTTDGLWTENVSAQQLVRVGYSGTGVAKNLHKTIERAGLWKKRGLDIRLIYFTSGATMGQAMVGGDLDISLTLMFPPY
jgi:ABC-type nitrate/sulfonate/bicarbonate transport system substrate-binding protein